MILAELDSDDARLNLLQERTHLTTLQPEIAALQSQIESESRRRLGRTQRFDPFG